MKKAIVTRADDNIRTMTDITHPVLKRYADKCDAEFLILSKILDVHMHHSIFVLKDMLKDYDRIACIDSDVLITSKCPDIFKYVDVDKVGSIYEDIGSREPDRLNRIAKVQIQRGSVGWKSGYINTGVCIFSKEHKAIFDIDLKKLWNDLGYDDVELGYQIHKNGMSIQELPVEFNLMSMFTEPWCNKSKTDAFIIHYAGNGFHYGILREEQIRQDALVMAKYGMLC